MSIWKKKTDERLSKLEQERRELRCEAQRGHKWRFVDASPKYEVTPTCAGWSVTCTWTTVNGESTDAGTSRLCRFRCYNCKSEQFFTEAELSPDQRRELKYLGVLAKKTKKGGKK